jgi:hypothetical protein
MSTRLKRSNPVRLKRKAFIASVSLFFFTLAIDVGKTSVQLIFEIEYGKRQTDQDGGVR